MAKQTKQSGHPGRSNAPRITNRKARHDYFIHESLECGIALTGSEVKSIRAGRVSLAESFARIEPATGEVWMFQMDISLYDNAPADRQHDPKRKRKLLIHKRQARDLITATMSKGMTLVPLTLYFNSRGIVKIELAIASGKGKSDKRETLKKPSNP